MIFLSVRGVSSLGPRRLKQPAGCRRRTCRSGVPNDFEAGFLVFSIRQSGEKRRLSATLNASCHGIVRSRQSETCFLCVRNDFHLYLRAGRKCIAFEAVSACSDGPSQSQVDRVVAPGPRGTAACRVAARSCGGLQDFTPQGASLFPRGRTPGAAVSRPRAPGSRISGFQGM